MAEIPNLRPIVVQLRARLRLRPTPRSLKSRPAMNGTPIRTTHTIHGRSYVIEVRPVARDRWRAQIARTPGGMTSLMPFYGTTPDDAAQQLAGWLQRAGSPRPRKETAI